MASSTKYMGCDLNKQIFMYMFLTNHLQTAINPKKTHENFLLIMYDDRKEKSRLKTLNFFSFLSPKESKNWIEWNRVKDHYSINYTHMKGILVPPWYVFVGLEEMEKYILSY